jgi:hypothetical protein
MCRAGSIPRSPTVWIAMRGNPFADIDNHGVIRVTSIAARADYRENAVFAGSMSVCRRKIRLLGRNSMERPERHTEPHARATQRVIASVATAEARDAVLRATATGCVVQFCQNEQELVRAAARDDDPLVIWEVARGAEAEIEAVATAMRKHSSSRSILLHVDLTRAAARQVLALALHLPYARISLRGQDDLHTGILGLRDNSAEQSAISRIALRLLPPVAARAKDIVATAVVAGRRRTYVRELSRFCGVPVRTIKSRLSSSRLVNPEHLIGQMIALHSLWRLDVLAWSPKRAFLAAGFNSRDAWSDYVTRHAGAHPPRLLFDGGFAGLLERSARELFPPSSERTS